jgi:hypothetical protein
MMKRYASVVCTLLGVVLLLAGSHLAAGEKKKEGPPDYEKMSAPGPEHKILAKMAGTWEAKVKAWFDPSKGPEESTGVMKKKIILGGRYLQEEFEGKAAGKPFQGGGVTGYDKVRKHYSSVWVDSMSTGLMISTGKYDPKTKTFTYTSDDIDPATGKKLKTRTVVRLIGDDEEHMEMFMETGPGMDFKVLEIHYTRKKV